MTDNCFCRYASGGDNDTARWKQTEALFDHVFGPVRNTENAPAFKVLQAFLEKNHDLLNNTQLAWFYTLADRKTYTGLNANTFNYMLMTAVLSGNQKLLCTLTQEASSYFPELTDNMFLSKKDYTDIYQQVLTDLQGKLAIYSNGEAPTAAVSLFKTISLFSDNAATTLRSRGVVVYTETVKLVRVSEPPDWMRVKFENKAATEIFKEVELYKSKEGTPFNRLISALVGDGINPETGKAFPGALVASMEGSFSKEIKMYKRYQQILATQQVVPTAPA